MNDGCISQLCRAAAYKHVNIFLGIPIDGTNSKTVQQSFDNFRRKVFGEKPETEVKKPKKDVKRKPEAEKDDRKSSQNKNGRKSSTKDDVEVLAENIEAVKLDSTDSSVKTKQSGNFYLTF
jgi:hypothetical protein